DCGIPNRLAAALPPVDSANLTASALNSSVYRRFGTDSFFPISPSVHQNVTNILMYVNRGQVQTARSPGLAPPRMRWTYKAVRRASVRIVRVQRHDSPIG